LLSRSIYNLIAPDQIEQVADRMFSLRSLGPAERFARACPFSGKPLGYYVDQTKTRPDGEAERGNESLGTLVRLVLQYNSGSSRKREGEIKQIGSGPAMIFMLALIQTRSCASLLPPSSLAPHFFAGSSASCHAKYKQEQREK
jgi:hypothetical protein